MIPDPGEILRRRVTAATIVRIMAFVPVGIAFGIGSTWVHVAFAERLRTSDHIAFGASISVMLAMAVIMWTIAPTHARHSVKMPKSVVCPACNYKIQGLAEARCPECGLPLTSEFIAKPGEKTPPPRDPDRVMLRQFATGIVRLAAALGLIGTVPGFIISVVEAYRYSAYTTNDEALLPVIYFGAFMLMFAALAYLAKRLSAIIVPPRTAFETPVEPDPSDPPPPIG